MKRAGAMILVTWCVAWAAWSTPPVIHGTNPGALIRNQPFTLEIHGVNLSTATVSISDVPDLKILSANDALIVVKSDAGPSKTGMLDIKVTTQGGDTQSVISSLDSTAVPQVNTVDFSPSSPTAGQPVTVTITGKNLTTLYNINAYVSGNHVFDAILSGSDTSVTANFSLPTHGEYTFTAFGQFGEIPLSATLTVQPDASSTVIATIVPDTWEEGSQPTVVITGTNMGTVDEVVIWSGPRGYSTNFLGSDSTTVRFTPYGTMPSGAWQVTLHSSGTFVATVPITITAVTPRINSVEPASWYTTDVISMVTIEGVGLGNVDEVVINGASVPVTIPRPNALTFVPPALTTAGTYPLQLKAGGTLVASTEIVVAQPGTVAIDPIPNGIPETDGMIRVTGLGLSDVVLVELIDSEGNTALRDPVHSPTGTTLDINLPPLPEGYYTFRFLNTHGVVLATAPFTVGDSSQPDTRGDPTDDPDVRGILNAQAATVERFYRAQTGNINSRLSSLRSAGSRENRQNDFNVSLNLPTSSRRRDRDRGQDRPEDGPGSIRLGDLARAKGDPALASLPSAPCPTKWSFWSDGTVSFGSLDEHGEVKLDHTTLGLTLGMDYAFGDRLVSGLAVGYSNDKTDVGSHGSEVKADGYTAALYASYLIRPSVFVEGMLGYTAIDFDTKRNTSEGHVKGDRDGDQYFASVAVGYEWRKESFTLTPFTRFETAITRLDSFAERGNRMALRYGKQDIEMYTGSLGLTASRTFRLSWAELTPSAGAEYAYNFKDDSRVALGYADTATMPYSFSATAVARNTYTATAGVEARFNDNFSMGVKYRGSFASRRDNHNISLQAVWSW